MFWNNKKGYDTKIIVCYRQKSELLNIVKSINQIIPRLVKEKIELEFYHLKIKSSGVKNYLIYVNSILEIMIRQTNSRISLALSPLVFSSDFIDNSSKIVFEREKIPLIPLAGVDSNLFDDAKEIGIEKNMKKLEKLIFTSNEIPSFLKKEVDYAIKTKKTISIKVGFNNVHDILDSLEENHWEFKQA